MEIEGVDREPKSVDAQETLQSFAASLTEALKAAIEVKNQADFVPITKKIKKFGGKLSLAEIRAYFGRKNSIFADSLRRFLESEPGRGTLPCPHSEDQVTDLLVFGLTLNRDGKHGLAWRALESLLFESPHDFATRVYLLPLSNYLLSKFLISLEKDGQFEIQKQKIYGWLTLFQGSSFETLFASVYVFLLRNLLKHNQIREAAQLLKNCKFPEHIGHSLLAKFLLYKASYLAKIGKIAQAANFVTESLRKAPDGRTRKGLNGFKLRARKLKLVLQLIMNEPPTHEWLNYCRFPPHYMSLVHAVNLGNHDEFARLMREHRSDFHRDDLLPLLEKMRSVVMRNALKKLSVAYSRITVEDVLRKIGADKDPNFDLNAFLTKSRGDLPDFSIDHKNGFIEFRKSTDNYAAAQTRENLIRRIQHLQGLEEQVAKNLRYRLQNKEGTQQKEEEGSGEDDYHLSDYSINDMDL